MSFLVLKFGTGHQMNICSTSKCRLLIVATFFKFLLSMHCMCKVKDCGYDKETIVEEQLGFGN